MLEVIGAAPGSHTEIDWIDTWKNSAEYRAVRQHLADLKEQRPREVGEQDTKQDKSSYREFAASTPVQITQVTKRIFQQLWRTPSYIYSKTALCVFSSLFIGFRYVLSSVCYSVAEPCVVSSFFNSPLSSQGLQNQMFSFFLLLTIFGQIVQQ